MSTVHDLFRRTAAEFVLRRVDGRWLKNVALELEALGARSDSLRRLAKLDDPRREECESLMNSAAQELGIEMPHATAAVLLLSFDVAREIVAGTVSPYEGARRIVSLRRVLDDPPVALDPFVYWESEYEDRPEDSAFIDDAIVENAKDFLDAFDRARL